MLSPVYAQHERTPLHEAVVNKDAATVKALLAAGAEMVNTVEFTEVDAVMFLKNAGDFVFT